MQTFPCGYRAAAVTEFTSEECDFLIECPCQISCAM